MHKLVGPIIQCYHHTDHLHVIYNKMILCRLYSGDLTIMPPGFCVGVICRLTPLTALVTLYSNPLLKPFIKTLY